MSDIVHKGQPKIDVVRTVTVTAAINCPNCDEVMNLDAAKVDIGNTVKCGNCDKKTYYPFPRPWRQRKKEVFLWIASLLVAWVVGILSNYAYSKLTASTQQTPNAAAIKEQK